MDNEKDYYEALGIEPPAEDVPPEEQTETLPPAEQDAPPTVDEEPLDIQQEETETENPGEQDEPPQMTDAQRRENAARRRQQEQEALTERIRREEQERFAQQERDLFKRVGLKNTFDPEQKDITSFAEFEAWQREYQRRQAEKDLQAGKLTPETISQVVAQMPQIQQVAALTQRAEEEARLAQQARFQAQVDAEMAEIRKLDPGVTSVEDIMKLDTGPEFTRLVKENGLSYIQAFRLANAQRLEQQRAEAARRQAVQQLRSKDHLTAHGQRGEIPETVPREVSDAMREMLPGLSDAEIKAYYSKYKPK